MADEIDRIREERQDILMMEADREDRRQRIEEMMVIAEVLDVGCEQAFVLPDGSTVKTGNSSKDTS